ncbi:MAG: biotin transporter BioY [Deferribacteraceae bacterium]|jgi:biotin transport system substrate-specific component|nr:biotin transporter BioY [Deferribacteraceae bacterium]
MTNNNAIVSTKARDVAMIGVLIAVCSVSGMIRIPIPAVMPVTLQVLVILLAPMLVGVKVSFAAITLYTILGLIGLPVFASGGGPAYVLVPSFGFLIGFMLSTIPNGLIAGKSTNFVRNLIAGATGFIVYEFFGWLGFWLNMNHVQGKAISPEAALAMAVLPFVLVDLVKLVLAAGIASALKRRL